MGVAGFAVVPLAGLRPVLTLRDSPFEPCGLLSCFFAVAVAPGRAAPWYLPFAAGATGLGFDAPFAPLLGVIGLLMSPFVALAGVVGRFAGPLVRSSSAFRFAAGGGAGRAEPGARGGASSPMEDRSPLRYCERSCQQHSRRRLVALLTLMVGGGYESNAPISTGYELSRMLW